MSVQWKSTKFTGVRYYEHLTRKHGLKKDKYYAIRYQWEGKRIEEGLGWASELDPRDKKHWTAEKAAIILGELKECAKGLKQGAMRLKDRRNIEYRKRESERAEQERLEREAITFENFFINTYIPQSKIDKRPRSVTREESLFKIWISPVIGGLPMKAITALHLEKLKQSMTEKGQSPRSIEYALSIVRHTFNVAKRLGNHEGENPTEKIKFPKPDNGRMRFLTRNEADKILDTLKQKSKDVHDITLLSLHTGLRFGEIASLTWQDVDLERSVLTIRDAKAGSRYAFLTEQTVEMFRSRIQTKPSDYVFQRRGGRKMREISHTFYRAVDDLKLNEGIDDPRLRICFHSCRHSYASWLIEHGADLYTVQKLIGHKTNVMTQRYAHLSENRLRDAASALGIALSSRTTGQNQMDPVADIGK